MKFFKNYHHYLIGLIILTIYSCQSKSNDSVIPETSYQSVLVLTDSLEAAKGSLYYFERDSTDLNWKIIGDKIPVVLGRNGLGWGSGLHDSTNMFSFPLKKEGDGKSPAGVFNLSFVFGYEAEEEMQNIKMPYLQITDMAECIDDVNSEYYNQIVKRDEIENVDWESSEKMKSYDIYYQLGVVVEHNCNPIKKEGGSCIFLHNWSNPNETMAGCTAMDPTKMREIVYWLNIDRQPVLIQLTKKAYNVLLMQWELPIIHQ